MSEMHEPNQVFMGAVPNHEKAQELMAELLAVAHPDSVYSEPVTVGAYTVITASEVTSSLGFGYGGGGGTDAVEGKTDSGSGGGGGGGGMATARPVAVISIGPDGVSVEPVVDPTKIVLAFFTTIGAMFLMFSGMRRHARKHLKHMR